MSAHDLVERESWQARGSCVGAPDPTLWFPERGADQSEAKAICAACPVKAECLEFALVQRIEYGVWGGESERARRRMRRGRPVVKRCGWCGDRFETWNRETYCSDGCRVMVHRKSSLDSYRPS